MKRPSDQAKLLFLGLLRTVSALATEPRLGASFYTTESPLTGPIALRLARKTDIPSIQRCNLATLPENYNPQFYVNHLRAWPDLALVAETIPDQRQSGSYSPFSASPEPNIVAYVLGKVEERQVDAGIEEMMTDQYGMPQHRYITERVGHVTSLAVLPTARRQGIAQDLMDQLHFHLQSLYRADCVSLHVRQSNYAAGKLYHGQGYVAVEQISNYYQDGEDAYFMKKQLGPYNHHHHHQQQQPYQQNEYQQPSQPWHQRRQGPTRFFGGLRKTRNWDQTPVHLRLPRMIGRDLVQQEEVLTGTM